MSLIAPPLTLKQVNRLSTQLPSKIKKKLSESKACCIPALYKYVFSVFLYNSRWEIHLSTTLRIGLQIADDSSIKFNMAKM